MSAFLNVSGQEVKGRPTSRGGVTSVEPSGFFNKTHGTFSGTAVAPMVLNWCCRDKNDGSGVFIRGDHTYDGLSEPAFVSVSEFSVGTAHSSSSAVCADSRRLLSSYSVLK